MSAHLCRSLHSFGAIQFIFNALLWLHFMRTFLNFPIARVRPSPTVWVGRTVTLSPQKQMPRWVRCAAELLAVVFMGNKRESRSSRTGFKPCCRADICERRDGRRVDRKSLRRPWISEKVLGCPGRSKKTVHWAALCWAELGGAKVLVVVSHWLGVTWGDRPQFEHCSKGATHEGRQLRGPPPTGYHLKGDLRGTSE